MEFDGVARYIGSRVVSGRRVVSHRAEEGVVDKLQRAAMDALSTVVTRRQVFWSAFMAGLAAPTMLYGQAPPHTGLVRDFSVAGSFAHVGRLLSQSAREIA